MSFRLSDEQRLIFELIADSRLTAIPEMDPDTAILAATDLIALGGDSRWTITKLGEAMLERQRCSLH